MPDLDQILLDVRYALRLLRKSPAFTLVAVLTLMLGIGANIVVFGVLNSVLLHPLAVTNPESLYQFRHQTWMSGRLLTTSYPAFEDFRERNTAFSGLIGVYGYSTARLTSNNSALTLHGDEVTGNYFDLLGIQPQAGRFFHEGEEHGPNSAPYLVLSDALWRSAFGGNRALIGTTVNLNNHPFTVVGIAPAQFHGLERFVWPDYWLPMLNEQQVEGSDYLQSRTAIRVTVIGRLKPGVTRRQATENLNSIAAQLSREYPQTDDGLPLRLIHPGLWGDEGDVIRGFLYSVNLLALLVLAAACANLASLFAARASDRSRELALRAALGASRARLASQLLTESVIVSIMGGIAGLIGADLLLGLLNRWPQAAEVHLDAGVDARVYLAGLVLTLASALLFGIVPAWQPIQTGSAKSRQRFALRDLLLGAQIAICTLLVTSSLVAVRGLDRALHVPLGIQPRGALLAYIDLSGQYPQTILSTIRALPGVTAVGAVDRTPMTGGSHGIPIFRPGTTEFKLANSALACYVFQMSPGYLPAAGTQLLAGRDFSWHDTAATPPVAVVNETFAQKMWGNRRPMGEHFIVAYRLTEVVGVVENGKYHDLQESPQPVAYLPFTQSSPGDLVFVVRGRNTPSQLAAALQRTFSVPVTVESWPDQLESELFPARAATAALGVMGLLAAMLAVTGIFGMAAYSVSRRMKELGIRLALGANKTQLITAAVGRPLALLAMGSTLGLMAGISASRFLGQIVYQANPRDPLVLAGTVLTMILLGITASAIPARRALIIDPSKLMRED